MSSNQHSTAKSRVIKGVNWIGLRTLIKREIERFTSVYLQTIIAPIITTLLFYAIFALAFGGVARSISGVPFLHFLAPGLIMMTMVQNAFANTSSSMIIAKLNGSIFDLLMPPLSYVEFMAGFLIGGLARGLCVGVATGLAMAVFVPISIHSIGLIILYAILGNILLSALGLVAGVWAEKFDHIAAVTNFIVTPLTFLSGTFYSVDSLPEFWHGLALYNPFFYMIDGFRYSFIGQADGDILTGILVLMGVNVFLIGAIYQMLRSGYKLRS